MKTSKIISATLLLVVATAAPNALWAAEKPVTEKEKIEALIKNIENLKDATFIRNAVTTTRKWRQNSLGANGRHGKKKSRQRWISSTKWPPCRALAANRT